VVAKSDVSDWVDQKGPACAKTIATLGRQYYDEDTRRRAYYRLAVSQLKDQIGVRTYDNAAAATSLDASAIGGPLLRQVERALISRIMRSKPKPTAVTTDGDYFLRKKAEKLDRVIEGEWYRAKAYPKLASMLRWGLRLGTGVLQVTDVDKRFGIEMIRPWNLLVDPSESAEGKPTRFYLRTIAGRKATAAKYGVDPTKLDGMSSRDDVFGTEQRSRADECEIWTAWYCDEDEGRVVVSSGGQILAESDWLYSRAPFVVFNWEQPMNGIWGDGLGVELSGHQYEVDAVRRTMRVQLRNSVGFWWLASGCETTTEQLDDRPGKVLRGGSIEPRWVSPEAHTQSLATWLDRTIADAFQVAGISQMSAAAEKPAGITAAAALQTWSDLDDLRNLPQAEAFENAVIELGELTIDACKRIYEDSGNYTTTVYDQGSSFGETIEWSDVDMDRDAFSLRLFPTSSLPSHPAARQQMVADMLNTGMIDQQQYMDLLGIPDVTRIMGLKTAPYDMAERLIDQILTKGEMATTVPELGDQKITLKLAQAHLLRALADGMPEDDDRIEMLRAFIEQCITWGQRGVDAVQAVSAPAASPSPPPMDPTMPAPPPEMPQGAPQ